METLRPNAAPLWAHSPMLERPEMGQVMAFAGNLLKQNQERQILQRQQEEENLLRQAFANAVDPETGQIDERLLANYVGSVNPELGIKTYGQNEKLGIDRENLTNTIYKTDQELLNKIDELGLREREVTSQENYRTRYGDYLDRSLDSTNADRLAKLEQSDRQHEEGLGIEERKVKLQERATKSDEAYKAWQMANPQRRSSTRINPDGSVDLTEEGVAVDPSGRAADIKKGIETEKEIEAKRDLASNQLGTYRQLRTVMNGISTGRGTTMLNEIEAWADTFELKVNKARLGQIEYANALAMEFALASLREIKGSDTEKEMERLLKIAPGPESSEARLALLDYMWEANARQEALVHKKYVELRDVDKRPYQISEEIRSYRSQLEQDKIAGMRKHFELVTGKKLGDKK